MRWQSSNQPDSQQTHCTSSSITKKLTPASPNSRHLLHQATDTCITKLATTVPASPSISKPADQQLFFSLQQTRSCNSTPVHKWQICLDCYQPSKTISIYPWLTIDWINRDINHPASATDASTSSTVFSYVYDHTIQQHLRSVLGTKIILIF